MKIRFFKQKIIIYYLQKANNFDGNHYGETKHSIWSVHRGGQQLGSYES